MILSRKSNADFFINAASPDLGKCQLLIPFPAKLGVTGQAAACAPQFGATSDHSDGRSVGRSNRSVGLIGRSNRNLPCRS